METPDQQSTSDRFASEAAIIADRCLGSRAGFGAFRKLGDVFHHTVALITESGLFSPPWSEPARFFPDPEFWHFYGRRIPGARSRFFKDLLSAPKVYDPECLWALFWSLVKAEHEFLFRYLPFWSHEERLTGHLVSANHGASVGIRRLVANIGDERPIRAQVLVRGHGDKPP